MTKRGWVLFIALGVLWGMPYLLIRIAVSAVDPLVVAGSRTLIGALLLLPIAWHRKVLLRRVSQVAVAARIHPDRDEHTLAPARARRDSAE